MKFQADLYKPLNLSKPMRYLEYIHVDKSNHVFVYTLSFLSTKYVYNSSWSLKIKCFRRCGKLSKETYVTSDNGDPSMMLLKFDSAFAKKATAGKGFSLKVTPADAGRFKKMH